MTVLVVMLLIAITLGLSYAMVRSQTTALQIQRNGDVRASARRAALTGLTMALKKMHTSQWCYGAGLSTTLAGSIGSHESYQVTYALGDPSLPAGDPDFPYRVTLHATGTATDAGDAGRTATHRARAVVCLTPRSVAAEPTDWVTMQKYTVYQSKSDSFEIDIPCRLEGPVRVQGKLRIAIHYPNDNNAWSRYLGDLNAMRLAGQPDYRPFNGPVYLPFLVQTGADLGALTVKLGVTAYDRPVNEARADWTLPVNHTAYQIYPGGPIYTIPWVGSTLENVTLEAEPSTNPLGLYYRDGDITIRKNVSIRGSLFSKHDVTIEGTNVRFEPVSLPALYGSDASVRLPAVTCNKFTVKSTASGSLSGLAAVFDDYSVEKSPATVEFAISGRLIARRLFIKERQPWEMVDWSGSYAEFLAQLGGAMGPVVPYFPVWMARKGYNPKPLVTIKPDASPIAYHWKKPYDPVYVPHPVDGGLRWDLLEWTDSL
ncbi:MAG: hypothetical protein A2V98_23445 [Planctomycetes bacterium RBG_16_64_12]|nr:MAG: hypothetical protein A2V98_23445 [Planctomycetes bacterium RBG_16_64_12]